MSEIGFLTPDRNAEKMRVDVEDLADRGNVPAGTAEGNRIMRKLLLTCGLIAAACFVPSVVSAQNRNNTGTGNSGMGSTGSSGFGSTGSSGFGSTGSSGFGGTSGFGSTGSSGFGAQGGQGTNGQTGFGAQNQLGANGNNGGILGRNTNQNGILGRNVQNQGLGGNNNLGGGRGGGGNRGNGNNGLNAQNGGSGNGGNANQTPIIRPRLEVAFDFPKPKTDAIQVKLETRLTKLSVKSPGLKSVTVAVEDKGEVVLSGEVGSESESKLAENLLRLEPGVRTVRNELTFPVATPTAE